MADRYILKAGDLRHRIAIQNVSTTGQDSFGEAVPTYTTAATVWGKIEPTSGRERFQGNEVIAQSTHKITMRYQPTVTITGKTRLQFESRNFNVLQASNIEERDRVLEIWCLEDTA